MRLSFAILLFFCLGALCAAAETKNDSPVVTEPAQVANASHVNPVEGVPGQGEKEPEKISPRMLLASRKIAKATPDKQPPKEKFSVPIERPEDKVPSVVAPKSIKIVRPNQSRGHQPNKIQRVKEVLDEVGEGPLTSLQKDPSKLSKLMKGPKVSKRDPSNDSFKDTKISSAHKPTVITVTPLGSGQSLKSVKNKRPFKLVEKRPAIALEKKPPTILKPAKFSEIIKVAPEDCSSEEQRPALKPKQFPKSAKVPIVVLVKKSPQIPVERSRVTDDVSNDGSSEEQRLILQPKEDFPKLFKPSKRIEVNDISASCSTEEQHPVQKVRKIRRQDSSCSASESNSGESSCSGSFSEECCEECCKESCESSEECDRNCDCDDYFDSCEWNSGSGDSSCSLEC